MQPPLCLPVSFHRWLLEWSFQARACATLPACLRVGTVMAWAADIETGGKAALLLAYLHFWSAIRTATTLTLPAGDDARQPHRSSAPVR